MNGAQVGIVFALGLLWGVLLYWELRDIYEEAKKEWERRRGIHHAIANIPDATERQKRALLKLFLPHGGVSAHGGNA